MPCRWRDEGVGRRCNGASVAIATEIGEYSPATHHIPVRTRRSRNEGDPHSVSASLVQRDLYLILASVVPVRLLDRAGGRAVRRLEVHRPVLRDGERGEQPPVLGEVRRQVTRRRLRSADPVPCDRRPVPPRSGTGRRIVVSQTQNWVWLVGPEGRAFHQGDPSRESVGCIRMAEDDARWVFEHLDVGDSVQIVK